MTGRAARRLAVGLLLAVGLAACSDVVDGKGTNALSGGPSPTESIPTPTGSVPTPSGSVPTSVPPTSPPPSTPANTPKANLTCPGIVFPAAKISFTCFSPNLTASTNNPVWPLTESAPVDSSGWRAETGAGHWGTRDTATLTSITEVVRTRMVINNAYGPRPVMTTILNHDANLRGRPIHTLATEFRLNETFARQRKTRVRVERLWIVAIETSFNDVSLWYISLPDLVKARWTQVPALLASIKVL